MKDAVVGGGQQRSSSSSGSCSGSGSSAYRLPSSKDVVTVGSSKHEMRSKIRRMNDHVEAKMDDDEPMKKRADAAAADRRGHAPRALGPRDAL